MTTFFDLPNDLQKHIITIYPIDMLDTLIKALPRHKKNYDFIIEYLFSLTTEHAIKWQTDYLNDPRNSEVFHRLLKNQSFGIYVNNAWDSPHSYPYNKKIIMAALKNISRYDAPPLTSSLITRTSNTEPNSNLFELLYLRFLNSNNETICWDILREMNKLIPKLNTEHIDQFVDLIKNGLDDESATFWHLIFVDTLPQLLLRLNQNQVQKLAIDLPKLTRWLLRPNHTTSLSCVLPLIQTLPFKKHDNYQSDTEEFLNLVNTSLSPQNDSYKNASYYDLLEYTSVLKSTYIQPLLTLMCSKLKQETKNNAKLVLEIIAKLIHRLPQEEKSNDEMIDNLLRSIDKINVQSDELTTLIPRFNRKQAQILLTSVLEIPIRQIYSAEGLLGQSERKEYFATLNTLLHPEDITWILEKLTHSKEISSILLEEVMEAFIIPNDIDSQKLHELAQNINRTTENYPSILQLTEKIKLSGALNAKDNEQNTQLQKNIVAQTIKLYNDKEEYAPCYVDDNSNKNSIFTKILNINLSDSTLNTLLTDTLAHDTAKKIITDKKEAYCKASKDSLVEKALRSKNSIFRKQVEQELLTQELDDSYLKDIMLLNYINPDFTTYQQHRTQNPTTFFKQVLRFDESDKIDIDKFIASAQRARF